MTHVKGFLICDQAIGNGLNLNTVNDYLLHKSINFIIDMGIDNTRLFVFTIFDDWLAERVFGMVHEEKIDDKERHVHIMMGIDPREMFDSFRSYFLTMNLIFYSLVKDFCDFGENTFVNYSINHDNFTEENEQNSQPFPSTIRKFCDFIL